MTQFFNLLDEPWLPVRMRDGTAQALGLLSVFEQAGDIAALAETQPPALIAEYRLLLAITHRALERAHTTWKVRERCNWYRNGLPAADMRDYLEHWRDRFWLFHGTAPFMQVAALADADETRDKLKPWTQISLACTSGNAPLLFDHSLDGSPSVIFAAQAVRTMLGFQAFTPGGLVRVLRDADNAGPLANTAAAMPVGPTLAATLCLALHPPSAPHRPDLPCWEMPPLTLAKLRALPTLASGPNDRYTRQSRAVLLLRDAEGNTVRWLRFAAGFALAEDPQAVDPMASYRMGSVGMVRLGFREGRAVWRDLPALVPDPTGRAAHPAAILSYAANLHLDLSGSYIEQPVLVAGVASDQAKLLRWRLEQIVLPGALLTDPGRAVLLRECVAEAEELFGKLREIAKEMIADTLPDPRSTATSARARAMLENAPAMALFFAHAERTLGVAMDLIAEGQEDDAMARWHLALRAASEATWSALVANLGASARAFRAQAKAWPGYNGLLRTLVPDKALLSITQEEVDTL
jgi:CRISPR system Cascade subunit CasA